MKPPPSATMDDLLMVALKETGSSFYWAIRLLPPQQRHDLAVVYLFCRIMDDIADGSLSDDDKQHRLTMWKEALFDPEAVSVPAEGQADLSEPEHTLRVPLLPLLHSVMARHQISAATLGEIIDGVRMDLRGGLVAPDDPTFTLYCRRVAGYVGVAIVRVLGCHGSSVDSFALATGDALQMTNILRDIGEDAAHGRLYVPRSVLTRVGVTETEPQDVLANPAFPQACTLLAQQAEDHYQSALSLFQALPRQERRRLRSPLVMLSTYHLILRRLKGRGWMPQNLNTPCRPSRLRLLWQAIRVWGRGE